MQENKTIYRIEYGLLESAHQDYTTLLTSCDYYDELEARTDYNILCDTLICGRWADLSEYVLKNDECIFVESLDIYEVY